ncbi:MAG TPA: hypothetical protein VFK21_01760 [Gammaproteobacteria bacterium]|nr:hypothetical protein [Gammaproteobacteria bacterium]
MRTMKSLALVHVFSLGIVYCAWSQIAVADESDLPPHTKSTPYSLEVLGNYGDPPQGDLYFSEPLLAPTEGFDYGAKLYGLYDGLGEGDDEFHLYVFPDGEFFLKDDCHCSTPAYVLAEGSWERHDNLIEFQIKTKSVSDCAHGAFDMFNGIYGSLARMDVFVTNTKGQAAGTVLVPEQTLMKAAMDRDFNQTHSFKDWKKELAELKAIKPLSADACKSTCSTAESSVSP